MTAEGLAELRRQRAATVAGTLGHFGRFKAMQATI
jgi:hypothetical protein